MRAQKARAATGFLRAQCCCFSVGLGGRNVVHVIEQETGMGQQVCIYTEQFTCLPQALPPAMHQ